MTRLLVRVDATHEKGLAHAARTSRLIASLPGSLEVELVGTGESLSRFFPGVTITPTGPDAGATVLARVEAFEPAAIMIDEPDMDPGLWAALEKVPHIKRIAIDDFGGPMPADLAVNGTVIPRYHTYTGLRSGGKSMCGGHYALLSRHFAGARHDAPRTGPIVAVCGGGDRAARWATTLAEIGPELAIGYGFTLIVGAAYPRFDALSEIARAHGTTLERGLPPETLARRLAEAPAAVLTGGMIAYEALAAGVPALVFPQLENLVEEIDWFAQRGGLIDLGLETGDKPEHVAAELTGLLNNPARARALSQTGPQLVDGLGMERAAAAVAGLLELGQGGEAAARSKR
ncbi:hypothetical protein GCM10011367_01190 [Marinicauda pacifica]|uniref:Rhodanese domain-containing protein n=1 Tax=Marinicauda pacifica TaxID=1133559 RepID=A0A4S2HDA4_9PROT|nr:hypothetical protein [Marinicauda pacifica]TGY93823.1 hypothetical protein E5162_00580 [Marinicauda pacifica]GGE30651.1 hypothetical protein GCM10011367_01190 [Marinicauda pacifica]